MGNHLIQRAALRGAVFRVGMVVVITGAVAQNKIALDFDEAQFAGRVLGEIRSLIGVLPQFLDVKAAHVGMGILAFVIPAHKNAGLCGAAHQGHGLGHHVQILFRVPGNADFGLGAELDDYPLLVIVGGRFGPAGKIVFSLRFHNAAGPLNSDNPRSG